jgi:hypothetical protein
MKVEGRRETYFCSTDWERPSRSVSSLKASSRAAEKDCAKVLGYVVSRIPSEL